MKPARHVHPRPGHRSSRAQALVELALVMPLLIGIVAVLFQFGILFVAYLSLIHETRDIGRYVAVHPDTKDGTSCTDAGSLFKQVCDDAPSVIDTGHLQTPTFSPNCASLVSGKCAARTAGTQMHITLAYDATPILFLPSNFKLGPWFQVKIPTALPAYDYYVMVEIH
jgi:Flp pilus assembly protein TadG